MQNLKKLNSNNMFVINKIVIKKINLFIKMDKIITKIKKQVIIVDND